MSNGDTPAILIVDDDKMITHAMANGLKEKGYQIITAFSGEEGLRVALESRPRLILLDYSLPDLDGVSVLRQLRQDSWGADVPVIIASNVYDVDIINAIMTLGVQDYVLKVDVNIEQIVTLVGKYVPLERVGDGPVTEA